MGLLILLISSLILLVIINSNAQLPSPGFYPSSRIPTIPFNQAYRSLWGSQHQRLDHGQQLLLWLDRSSGSGFKSLRPYRSGYFGTAIKLHPGYTAGLSNNEDHPGSHDEVDIEFLGTTFGKPYTLQTNVYIRGSGDVGNNNIIGREEKIHLWFDPTKDFHNYAILWTPNQIIFFVDDVPIRRYTRKSDATFPLRPMYVYGSIWDASSWATENGRYKADYKYQPFYARYNNFKIRACTSNSSPSSCRPPSSSPATTGGGLSRQQVAAMLWVRKNFKVYDYCRDPKRDHTQTPEC